MLQYPNKQAVAINDKWPKGHVRLAMAYIELGGHSNDACISLQRAISLDRNNKEAREMLVEEMRKRNNRERTGNGNSSSSSSADQEGSRGEATASGSSPTTSQSNPRESRPTEETPRDSIPSASAATPPPEQSQSTNNNTGRHFDGIDIDDIEPPNDYYGLSLSERMQRHFAQAVTWFHSQSDDIQTLFKVAICFLILYVLLGGRFGLDYVLGGGGNNNLARRGNYDQGNAYDRYSPSSSSTYSSSYESSNSHNSYNDQRQAGGSSGYNDRSNSQNDRYYSRYGNDNHHSSSSYGQEQRQTTGSSGGYNDRNNPQNDRYYSRYGNDNDNYYQPRGRRTSTSTSYQIPSMAIMLIVGFVCHRFGLNPFQVMYFVNLMQGGRGGHRGMGRFGYGGFRGGMGGGFGGGGFGGGFGRRRYGMGRRGRGGFY